MSNRGRIDRMQDEAAATEREKKEARKQSAATGRGRAKAEPGRMKIVWGIKNSEGEIIAAFPYPEKARAEAEAQRLRDNGQRGCLVCPHKVPF